MTSTQSLRCLTTGRVFVVVTKRKHKDDSTGGVKVVHLKAEHVEMSVRADLVERYFKVVED